METLVVPDPLARSNEGRRPRRESAENPAGNGGVFLGRTLGLLLEGGLIASHRSSSTGDSGQGAV
jgi:hypothetical protein